MKKNNKAYQQKVAASDENNVVKKVLSNAPKATAEQLYLSRLLHSNADDIDYQRKLQQIQECAACDLEKAISVLHDADNNVQRAIEYILDRKCDNDWHDTVTKKSKSRRHTEKKSKSSNSVIGGSKVSFVSSIIVKDGSESSNRVMENFSKNAKTRNSTKHLKKMRASSIEAVVVEKDPSLEASQPESWGIECGEWKGEAIEVFNSSVNIPVNIHDDTELLKLLTLEPEPDAEIGETEKSIEELQTVQIKSDKEDDIRASSNEQTDNQVQMVKDRLFNTYARSVTPPSSFVPDVPVFFAPGFRNTLMTGDSVTDHGAVQNHAIHFNQISYPCTKLDQPTEMPKSDQVPERKSINEQGVDSHAMIRPSNQCDFSPVVNTLLQSVRSLHPNLQKDQSYPISLQNTSVHKETYTNTQDPSSVQNRAQMQPVIEIENSKPYSYNLLTGLSQNMKQANLEMHVGKSQPSPMNKPICTMPLNASQQSLPTSQPQLHPVMHPSFPQLLSHLQPNVPMFNFSGSSGPAAAPHMFEMDPFQALQQHQRVLFEMQQSQHSQHMQTVANENNLSTTAAEVISSAKSSVPMHQANVGSGIAFLPYPGPMVLMNGYPNAYLGQQQTTQSGGPRTQSTSNVGSTLSHPSNQYPKAISSAAAYANYQGLRQSNFEEFGDALYSNLAKQVAYKHAPNGAQEYYNPLQQSPKPGGVPDLSLGSKLQQHASGLPPAQPTPQSQQPHAQNAQPQNLYPHHAAAQYAMYHPQCMAMAAAAVAAQSQQQPQGAPSSITPGSGSMASLQTRPTH